MKKNFNLIKNEKNEKGSDLTLQLKREISRFSYVAAGKFPHASPEHKEDIKVALQLYSQALLLADHPELSSEARRHMQMARRLSK